MLCSDIAVAPTSLSVRAAIGPDQFHGSDRAPQVGAQHQPFGRAHRERSQVERAAPEQRVADFVEHRAGAVTCDDVLRVKEPFLTGCGLDAEAQIAAAPRQVEDELWPIASVHAKGRIRAVERAVENFSPVLNHEVRAFRAVAQWTRSLPLEDSLRSDRGHHHEQQPGQHHAGERGFYGGRSHFTSTKHVEGHKVLRPSIHF